MKNFQTISEIISLQFTVFPHKFDSTQINQNRISCMVNFVYELHNEFTNNLRLRILGN